MFREKSGITCNFSSSRRCRRGWRWRSGRGTSHGAGLGQISYLRVGCKRSVPSPLEPITLRGSSPSRPGLPSPIIIIKRSCLPRFYAHASHAHTPHKGTPLPFLLIFLSPQRALYPILSNPNYSKYTAHLDSCTYMYDYPICESFADSVEIT